MRHSVWLATGLMVEAATPSDAAEQARKWLTDTLERCPPQEDGSIALVRPALIFDEIAVLALQLRFLQEGGGESAALRIARLRAEVTAELEQQQQQQGHEVLHAFADDSAPGGS